SSGASPRRCDRSASHRSRPSAWARATRSAWISALDPRAARRLHAACRSGTTSAMRGPPRPIAIILVLSLALGACKTAVRTGLSEREANQLIVALDAAAIGASKETDTGARDRYRVEVMNTDAARAIALLEAQHLPSRAEPGLDALYQDAA